MRNRSLRAFSALGILLPAAYASAQVPRVIYSDIVTSPTSEVPGLPGVRFETFDRPFRSPDGSRWIFSAITDITATASDEVVVLGSGLSGSVVVQEGVTQVAPPATELVGLIDQRLSVTNAGDFVYATNTDGPTTSDEVIGRRSGAVYDVPVREGDPAPGFPAGITLGASINAGYLASDGRVGFLTSLVGTGSTSTDAAVIFGNTVIAQEGVTVPAGQAGGGTAPWQFFDFESVYFANNGATHLIQGDTNAATTEDDILVFNGNVVLQEGHPVPSSSLPAPIALNGIQEAILTPGGDWFARGNVADGTGSLSTDFVVRNGTVLATTGSAVPGGLAGETFDDAVFTTTFFSMTGNDVGDYVYGGTTSNPDATRNAVLVFNNAFVLLREGDPVDLNGNGVFDDDAFVSVFNNDDAFLSNDLNYYFTADLRNAAGTALGQAFIVMPIPEPGALSLLAVGAIGLLRRRA